MTSKTFFPHRTIDDLELRFVSLTLDGKQRSVGDGRNVKLLGDDWSTLVLELEMASPELEVVLPPTERRRLPVRHVVAVNCVDTRLLSMIDGVASKAGVRFPLVMSRADVRGTIELTPYVLRETRREGGDGLAFEEGAIVARGDSVSIVVDEPDSMLGGVLKGTWEDFGAKEAPEVLRAYARATHFVSLVDPPVLYLNSGVPGLQALLSSKKNAGPEAALRDVVFDGISGAVWLTLTIGAAATCVELEGERLAPASEWARKVLEYVAPRVTGETDVGDAVDAIVKQLRDQDASGAVIGKIEAHFQQRDDFGPHLEKLFAAMRKED